jgi:hypothetical protein
MRYCSCYRTRKYILLVLTVLHLHLNVLRVLAVGARRRACDEHVHTRAHSTTYVKPCARAREPRQRSHRERARPRERQRSRARQRAREKRATRVWEWGGGAHVPWSCSRSRSSPGPPVGARTLWSCHSITLTPSAPAREARSAAREGRDARWAWGRGEEGARGERTWRGEGVRPGVERAARSKEEVRCEGECVARTYPSPRNLEKITCLVAYYVCSMYK